MSWWLLLKKIIQCTTDVLQMMNVGVLGGSCVVLLERIVERTKDKGSFEVFLVGCARRKVKCF